MSKYVQIALGRASPGVGALRWCCRAALSAQEEMWVRRGRQGRALPGGSLQGRLFFLSIQHLPATAHRNDVADLLEERFGQQQGSNQLDPEDILRMKALAEDIWHAWSQYLQRHEQSAFSQAHSRARMRRFYQPMSNSR